MRKALGEVVYDRHYYTTLAPTTGLRFGEKGLDLRRIDVRALDFPDATFAVVHSNATWEHLPEVPRSNLELARVLKPGGLAYIEIHLFASISGGHDLPWIVPGKVDLAGVSPWRHLRDPNWEAPVFLNRLREEQFRIAFEETSLLVVTEWTTEYTEGSEYLGSCERQELTTYTDDELTKRSVIAVLRRKP